MDGCSVGQGCNVGVNEASSPGIGIGNQRFSHDLGETNNWETVHGKNTGQCFHMASSEDYRDKDWHMASSEDYKNSKQRLAMDSSESYAVPYPMKNTTYEKEDRNTSFVGVSYVQGKIFAFADSKSSRSVNGLTKIDMERPQVNRIFQNRKFIMAMYGSNSFPIFKDEKTHVIYLEDLVKELIGEEDTFIEAMYKIKKYLRQNLTQEVRDLCFIAGYWSEDDPSEAVITLASVNKSKLQFNEPGHKNDDVLYGGHHLLTSNPEYLRLELNKTIDMFEGKGEYNPVGLPVRVVEFTRD